MTPDGRMANTMVAGTPLARLRLGITGPDGKRAVIEFVRDEKTTELVAQLDPAPALAQETQTSTPRVCGLCGYINSDEPRADGARCADESPHRLSLTDESARPVTRVIQV